MTASPVNVRTELVKGFRTLKEYCVNWVGVTYH